MGMQVLVLGGYGLIGLEIMRALHAAGHEPIGLGRSRVQGPRVFPQGAWIVADIAALTTPAAWAGHLRGVAAVVNAAGALQDSPRDNLSAVQRDAILALIAACEAEGVRAFVQISAPGAQPSANTAFLRTKGQADAALRDSGLEWTILKPALVIAREAYGGTHLLRMLAAFPFMQPIAMGQVLVQTVAAHDVAAAARACLERRVPARRDYELAEDTARPLRDVIAALRAWMGFAPAAALWSVPGWMTTIIGWVADGAGVLGWRSPLRTTALRVLQGGVTADPSAWIAAGGARLQSLEQTLAAMPAGAGERAHARSALVAPVLLVTLAIFWLASGVIGLVQREAAAQVLAATPAAHLAMAFVMVGAGADIAIGCALLARRFVRGAALASIGLAVAYLLAGSFLTPHLWLDPLGPFLKVFPAIALAIAVCAQSAER